MSHQWVILIVIDKLHDLQGQIDILQQMSAVASCAWTYGQEWTDEICLANNSAIISQNLSAPIGAALVEYAPREAMYRMLAALRNAHRTTRTHATTSRRRHDLRTMRHDTTQQVMEHARPDRRRPVCAAPASRSRANISQKPVIMLHVTCPREHAWGASRPDPCFSLMSNNDDVINESFRCSYMAHTRIHSENGNLVCPDCGENFQDRNNDFNKHIKLHCFHTSRIEGYRCPVSDYTRLD